MATSDRYPLDFYEALIALRDKLKEQGTWNLYHDSYISWAAISVISNLETARSLEGFAAIANKMKECGLEELDLANADISSLESPWHQQRIQDIRHLPMAELVFAHYADLKIRRNGCENHASRVRMENARLHSEIDELNRRIADLEHEAEKKREGDRGFRALHLIQDRPLHHGASSWPARHDKEEAIAPIDQPLFEWCCKG